MEDQELVAAARLGDVAAYEELVHRHQQVAFRVALLVVRDPEEAEDAAQTGFIKAYQALDSFRTDGSFRPWLLQIVANEARNRRRSAGRQLRLLDRAGRQQNPSAAEPSPERNAVREEIRADVRTALEELSEMDRLVIGYRYFFELTESEMAEALDVPRGTVKSRLSRALGRLRQKLQEREGSIHE